jgi:hypothetical protein
MDDRAGVARVGDIGSKICDDLGEAEHIGIEIEADGCRLGSGHAARDDVS